MASTIIYAMYAYQKKHSITKRCIDNTQYAYDCIRFNYPNQPLKVAAILMTSIDPENNELKVWGGHLVLLLNGTDVLDPSYETFSLKDRHYFTSVSKMLEIYPSIRTEPNFLEGIVKNYLHFRTIAEEIMSGSIRVSDKAYYNAQADYVERCLKG